jgi:hypothetical protein
VRSQGVLREDMQGERIGERLQLQCQCGQAQPSTSSHQLGVGRMRNILGQGGQISPIQDNSHKEMGCQPTGVSRNGCSACWSGALHSS